MKKTKELVFQWVFFNILREVYIYKQKGGGYKNILVEIENYIS